MIIISMSELPSWYYEGNHWKQKNKFEPFLNVVTGLSEREYAVYLRRAKVEMCTYCMYPSM